MRAFFATLLLIIVYLAIKPGPYEQTSFGGYLLIALALMPFVYLGTAAKKADERGSQRRRDVATQRTFVSPAEEPRAARSAAPPADPSERRILFLRPFSADEALLVRNPRKDGCLTLVVPMYSMILHDRVSLDEGLRLHLAPYGELTAIGAIGEPVGASRLRVGDAEWRDHFLRLVGGARMIFLYPSLRPGTRRETEHVARHPELLAKTVLLMPPAGSAETRDLPEIRRVLRTLGLVFDPGPRQGEGLLLSAAGTSVARADVIERSGAHYRLNRRAITDLAGRVPTRRRPVTVAGAG